jgi:hypothetical protein
VTREELAPAGPREAKDVLEVWNRCRERTDDRGIERPAHRREKKNRSDARADLEVAIGNVLVRHQIAGEVKEQPKRHGTAARADE